MNNIIEQVQSNNITTLHISDADDAGDEELLLENSKKLGKAFETNTSIISIRFDGNYLGCLRANDERRNLIKSIGKISSIREIHLEDSLLMVSDIMDMLISAKHVRVIKLNKLILQGVLDDFQMAEMALYQHLYLKEFDMKDCIPAVKEISLKSFYQVGRNWTANKQRGDDDNRLVHNPKNARTA